MGWFGSGKPKRVPIEEQLRILASCGIGLAPGNNPSVFAAEHEPSEYEEDPFQLPLVVMGGEADQGKSASGFLSDDIWHFDTECIEDHGAYVGIARRFLALAHGELPLENVHDHVDVEEGVAWLAFDLDGKSHRWDAKVEDDWVDPSMLSRFAKLMKERSPTGRRFTYIDLGGQDCLIGSSTPNQIAALRKLTGLDVKWLE